MAIPSGALVSTPPPPNPPHRVVSAKEKLRRAVAEVQRDRGQGPAASPAPITPQGSRTVTTYLPRTCPLGRAYPWGAPPYPLGCGEMIEGDVLVFLLRIS